MSFDKFENGKRFQSRCFKTDFTCSRCNSKLTEIRRRISSKKNSRVTAIYGYYCLRCDKEKFGLIEWSIKNS